MFGMAFGVLADELKDFLELISKEKRNYDLVILGLDARTGNIPKRIEWIENHIYKNITNIRSPL